MLSLLKTTFDKVNATVGSQTRSPAGPRGPVTHKKWDVGGLLWVGLCDLSLNIKKKPLAPYWCSNAVAKTSWFWWATRKRIDSNLIVGKMEFGLSLAWLILLRENTVDVRKQSFPTSLLFTFTLETFSSSLSKWLICSLHRLLFQVSQHLGL